MNRRDFLTLRTRGEQRIVELSCERLYMRYADARSGVGRWDPPPPIGATQQAWEGEPPTQIRTPTTRDLFETLERELARADVLTVLDSERVQVKLKDAGSSAIISDSEDSSSLYVVMPMRL